MSTALLVAGLTLAAGAAMAVGGAIARAEPFGKRPWRDDFRHAVVAFGGGALLSAVALVLVPEGTAQLTVLPAAFAFAAGGVAFMLLDVLLDRYQSPAGQLAAMLADFVPEALALGAAFAAGDDSGPLLALLIGVQNLPEGFNAYGEMTASGKIGGSAVIAAFAAMALLGPAAGLTGLWWLSAYPQAVAAIMLFAAGGILYLTFEDIAPAAPLKGRWAPPLGAVAGFLLGMIGQMVM